LTFVLDAYSAGGGEHYKEVIFHIKSGGAPQNKTKQKLNPCNK